MTAKANSGLARPLLALARILDYPTVELQQHADEIAAILAAAPGLNEDESEAVRAFAKGLAGQRLFDIQAEYVETFDQGRKVSLYVFEHVYGESRDRGPAMIELKKAYRDYGLDTNTRELPDFLPVFLEFCAQVPPDAAMTWLVETTHILQRVCVRLAERGSGYATTLTVLLRMIGADPAPEDLTHMAGEERRDDTPEAMDEIWMEKPVTFGPGEDLTDCGATRQTPPEPKTAQRSAHTNTHQGGQP